MTLMASKKRVLDVCMIYKSDVNSLAVGHRIAESEERLFQVLEGRVEAGRPAPPFQAYPLQ